MLRIFRKNRGQNTAEYAIVLALIIAAAIAMQTYIKRGLQGRVKGAVDRLANETSEAIGPVSGLGDTMQYEPYYLESNFATNRTTNDVETMAEGGGVTRNANAETTRTGVQQMRGYTGSEE